MNTLSSIVAGPGDRPRYTGVGLLTDNVEAWQAKRDLIAQAQRTLDLVYFILEIDGTTCRLMLDLIAAADRGVKVRLLVDYYMTFGQATVLRTLGATRNIEVRRYRPPAAAWLAALHAAGIDENLFVQGLMTTNSALLVQAIKDNTVFPVSLLADIRALRGGSDESRVEFALRVLATLRGMMTDAAAEPQSDDLVRRTLDQLSRVGAKLSLEVEIVQGLQHFLHRTHHKLLLADSRNFIVGGRNLGDAYQRGDPPKGRAFQDTDVLVSDSQPATTEHVAAFQTLWDFPMSIDIMQADPLDPRPALAIEVLQEKAGEVEPLQFAQSVELGRSLPDMDGYIVNNLPDDAGDAAITLAYVSRIQDFAARGAPGVIDIVSAYVYFVGDDSDGAPLFELRASLLAAARAGVTVNVHTNSITTTDLRPVNRAAYPKLIELIEGGVNVFELNEGQGSLHTKCAALGNEWLMVGSYNMDPRSELYDTNNLIVFRDRGGMATTAFRDARVRGLKWTQLTAESVRRLAAETKQKATDFSLVRRLL